MTNGTITQILPLKKSRTEAVYYRITFAIETLTGRSKWAKTDVVPIYRNFRLWREIITTNAVGTYCRGLVLKQPNEVDADYLEGYTLPSQKPQRPVAKQEALL